VTCDAFSFAGVGDHLELRHDSDGFQINRKSPQDFNSFEMMVDQESQSSGGDQNKLDSEFIVFLIVGGLELGINQVDGSVTAEKVNAFHDSVVQGNVYGEKVDVTGCEDERE